MTMLRYCSSLSHAIKLQTCARGRHENVFIGLDTAAHLWLSWTFPDSGLVTDNKDRETLNHKIYLNEKDDNSTTQKQDFLEITVTSAWSSKVKVPCFGTFGSSEGLFDPVGGCIVTVLVDRAVTIQPPNLYLALYVHLYTLTVHYVHTCTLQTTHMYTITTLCTHLYTTDYTPVHYRLLTCTP